MSMKRPLRWLDVLSSGVLLVACAVVTVEALPALVRAAGVGGPAPLLARAPSPRELQHPAPAVHHGFAFQQDDEDERDPIDDLDRLYPGERPGMFPHAAPGALAHPGGADDDTHSVGKIERGKSQLGLAKKALTLTEEPGGSGVAGEVKAGELVMVVKETGEWALVAHEGGGTLEMGWVRKSELAIR
jgi:hypothetical protein